MGKVAIVINLILVILLVIIYDEAPFSKNTSLSNNKFIKKSYQYIVSERVARLLNLYLLLAIYLNNMQAELIIRLIKAFYNDN